MKKDKVKVYFFEILFMFFLFFAIFASNIFNRVVISIVFLIYMILMCLLFQNKKINSIYNKQIIIWMTIFAFLYIGIFYLMGLYFGFRYSKVLFSIKTLFKYIVPLIIIIISSEVIRKKNIQINLSIIITYSIMILVDLIIYNGIYSLAKLDDFLIALGFVLFASISCNLLYNYISIRYGEKSIIIYKLITILYVYIIPIVPDVYIFLQSFLRMLYPYLIYILLEKNYSSYDFTISHNEKKNEIIKNTILVVTMSIFIMLISCQFNYGILVVG